MSLGVLRGSFKRARFIHAAAIQVLARCRTLLDYITTRNYMLSVRNENYQRQSKQCGNARNYSDSKFFYLFYYSHNDNNCLLFLLIKLKDSCIIIESLHIFDYVSVKI